MGAFATLLKIADPFVIALTGLLSYYIRFDNLDLPVFYQAAIFVVFALAIVVFGVFDVYRARLDEGLRQQVMGVVGGWFGIVVGLVVLMYATRTGALFSRQWLGVWSLLALVGLVLLRLVALAALRAVFRRGVLTRHIAIAGAGRLGREIARLLAHSPWTGITVAAFFDDSSALAGQSVEGVPIRGSVDKVKDMVRSERFDQVWIALPLRAEERMRRLMEELAPLNVKVRFVPDIFSFQLLNHSVTEIGGLPVVNVTESPFAGVKGALKWLEDKTVALLVLALIWPLMLAIAIGIKLGSPGAVIFRQRRGGLDNRQIVVWKFRTMTVHDELTYGDVPQATKNDPRVTRFGAFLRRTSLDELPQLINVLAGDMSIVGPRPHASWMDDFYRDKIPKYMLRGWIKPGITGWAQICGWRGETDEMWKMDMRVQHDLWYIEHWSLGLDLYIILMTMFRLRGPQAY